MQTKKKPFHANATKALTVRAPQASDVAPVTMFERLAKDPTVPVEKLEKLIELQERITAHDARAAFSEAFAAMQGQIPVITKRGEISVEGKVRSKFATFADIQRIVRPIMQAHGFALRHRNAYVENGRMLKVVGILSHRSGHSEEDEFIAPLDDSGKKNPIQAIGSTRTYGQRYTTIALLNISTEDNADDDDGHGAFQPPPRRVAGPREAQPSRHVATSDANGSQPISDFTTGEGEAKKYGQAQRLMVILRKAGRKPEALKAWLQVVYNIDSVKQIQRKDYEAVCDAVMAPGPLMVPDREVGEEG